MAKTKGKDDKKAEEPVIEYERIEPPNGQDIEFRAPEGYEATFPIDCSHLNTDGWKTKQPISDTKYAPSRQMNELHQREREILMSIAGGNEADEPRRTPPQVQGYNAVGVPKFRYKFGKHAFDLMVTAQRRWAAAWKGVETGAERDELSKRARGMLTVREALATMDEETAARLREDYPDWFDLPSASTAKARGPPEDYNWYGGDIEAPPGTSAIVWDLTTDKPFVKRKHDENGKATPPAQSMPAQPPAKKAKDSNGEARATAETRDTTENATSVSAPPPAKKARGSNGKVRATAESRNSMGTDPEASPPATELARAQPNLDRDLHHEQMGTREAPRPGGREFGEDARKQSNGRDRTNARPVAVKEETPEAETGPQDQHAAQRPARRVVGLGQDAPENETGQQVQLAAQRPARRVVGQDARTQSNSRDGNKATTATTVAVKKETAETVDLTDDQPYAPMPTAAVASHGGQGGPHADDEEADLQLQLKKVAAVKRKAAADEAEVDLELRLLRMKQRKL